MRGHCRCRALISFRPGEVHAHTVKQIAEAPESSIVILNNQSEAASERISIRRIHLNRKITLHVPLSIGRLVTVPALVPEKYAPGIEIIGYDVRRCRPK